MLRTAVYLWDEACQLAELAKPDEALALTATYFSGSREGIDGAPQAGIRRGAFQPGLIFCARRKFPNIAKLLTSEKSFQREGMMLNKPIQASKQIDGMSMSAEFHRDTGRLRILDAGVVIAEWFPPHSWFAIASVAAYSTWGTRPNECDLALVLDDFVLERNGTRGLVIR